MKVFEVFAEYIENGSTDFHQSYVIFRQSSIVSFEIKKVKTGHSLLPWQPIHDECCTKNHDLRGEKWHLLKFSNQFCDFELRFDIISPKLPLTSYVSLIHPKTKK